MKILIVTLADQPYWPLARISNPNKAAYAAKHGYDFWSFTRLYKPDKPASWNKLYALAQASYCEQQNYDWFFWTDADSLIMNSGLRLEELIESKSPQFTEFKGDFGENLIVAADENGYNFGQFLIKNCRWSDQLIKLADERTEYINHPWWEQAALHAVIKENSWENCIKVVDQSKLNRLVPSGPEHNTLARYRSQVEKVWWEDDFILHFSGCGGERAPLRLEAMQYYAARTK